MALTEVEKVRLRIADTDVENALLSDAEIESLLEESTVIGAAIGALESLAARYSREFDFATDDQKFNRSQKAKAFLALAKHLRETNGDVGTIPTLRDDGYSAGVGNEDTDASITGGRIRAGYVDPDFHP